MKYVANPRGSIRFLDDDSAKQVLQTPGWVEITDPVLQKQAYLPQFDRGDGAQTTAYILQAEFKEEKLESFKTRIV